MAIYIEMPKLSDTMTEGTLIKWRKNEGDKVEAGDVLAEIETDKATMEMEAFDDGILHKFLIQAGGKAPVGGKIALLLEKGEKPPAEGEAVPDSPKKAAAKADTIAPEGAKESAAAKPAASAPAKKSSGERVKASPLAKKIAASKGVDLSGLQADVSSPRTSKALPPRVLLRRARPRPPSPLHLPARVTRKSRSAACAASSLSASSRARARSRISISTSKSTPARS